MRNPYRLSTSAFYVDTEEKKEKGAATAGCWCAAVFRPEKKIASSYNINAISSKLLAIKLLRSLLNYLEFIFFTGGLFKTFVKIVGERNLYL